MRDLVTADARAYLDHAATTPLRPAARAAMLEAWDIGGNPASTHTAGRRARAVLERARETIAARLGADPYRVVFTSGGTEADNLALLGLAAAAPGPVVVSSIEHHAVLDAAAATGREVLELPVDRAGVVQVAELRWLLRDVRPTVVSVMAANNEVGTLQPVATLAAICADAGVPFHTDAVQAPAHAAAAVARGAWATVSAHKVGGPVGIGALVVGAGPDPVPQTHGGGQERRLRSGTVPVALAAGFAAALEESMAADGSALAHHRDRLMVAMTAAGGEVTGPASPAVVPDRRTGATAERAAHIAHAVFPGVDAEVLLMLLDRAGVDASSGSACSAGVLRPSHVVRKMGFTDRQARQCLRLSVGWTTTAADVDRVVRALPGAVEVARRAG